MKNTLNLNSAKNRTPKKKLLKDKRFLPLFITQFFGSFNDNAFKNAFLVWFTFTHVHYYGLDAPSMMSIAAALFILPFFLFSASAGQYADKYEKAWLTKKIKLVEILLMLLCSLFFYFQSVFGLLFILFAMGAQSTFFGPIKYSLLPEQLKSNELIQANSYIEAGTFLSILLGTIAGGVIILTESGILIVSVFLILFACIGYFASSYIPEAPIRDLQLKINYHILKETKRIIQFAKQDSVVWQSINAISWFWFVGVTFLTQFPVYTKDMIHANEQVVTLFLSIFSIGIGIGSILCNLLIKDKISTKIVPLGGIGLSLSIIFFLISSHFYLHIYDLQAVHIVESINMQDSIPLINSIHLTNSSPLLLNISAFLDIGFASYTIMLSLLSIAIMSGIYVVPLYALMQDRADKSRISRIIAANNVMNALFMVISSILGLFLFSLGFNILDLFLIIAILNFFVSIAIKKSTILLV